MDNRLIEIARKTQHDTTANRLAGSPTTENILALVDDALTITSRFSDAIKQQAEPLACAAGCHACCYLMATVSAPEALAIAHHLRETRSPEELRQLKQEIRKSQKQTRTLNSHARVRAKIACPLLSDTGNCTIYEFRPLDCMTYHSLSRQACEDILQQPDQGHPVNEDLRAIGMGVKTGLGQGIAGANLESPALRYELIEALHIALNDKNGMKKYLAGQNIFKPAALITDNETGIGYKIKYAPVRLKAEAKRVFDLEKQRTRQTKNK